MKYLLVTLIFFSCKEEKKPLPKFTIQVRSIDRTKDTGIYEGGVLHIEPNVVIEYEGRYVNWEAFTTNGETIFKGEIKK